MRNTIVSHTTAASAAPSHSYVAAHAKEQHSSRRSEKSQHHATDHTLLFVREKNWRKKLESENASRATTSRRRPRIYLMQWRAHMDETKTNRLRVGSTSHPADSLVSESVSHAPLSPTTATRQPCTPTQRPDRCAHTIWLKMPSQDLSFAAVFEGSATKTDQDRAQADTPRQKPLLCTKDTTIK